jgi:hypothetical protein
MLAQTVPPSGMHGVGPSWSVPSREQGEGEGYVNGGQCEWAHLEEDEALVQLWVERGQVVQQIAPVGTTGGIRCKVN